MLNRIVKVIKNNIKNYKFYMNIKKSYKRKNKDITYLTFFNDLKTHIPSDYFTKKNWMLKLIKLTGSIHILKNNDGHSLALNGLYFVIISCISCPNLFKEYQRCDIKFKNTKLLYFLSIYFDSRFIYFIKEDELTIKMAKNSINVSSINNEFIFPTKLLKNENFLDYCLLDDSFYRLEFLQQISNEVLFKKDILYKLNKKLILSQQRKIIATFIYRRIKSKKEFKKFARFFSDVLISKNLFKNEKNLIVKYSLRENIFYTLKYLGNKRTDASFFDFLID